MTRIRTTPFLAWIKSLTVWSKGVALLFILSCTNGPSDDGSTPPNTESNTDDESTEVVVGGFSLQGVVHDVTTWTRTGGGLCLSAADTLPLAQGQDVTPNASTIVEADGTWLIEDIDMGSTTGIVLLLETCSGDPTMFPTATLIGPEVWSGKGPNDTVNGIEVFHIGLNQIEQWESGLTLGGNDLPLAETGAFIGHIEDLKGQHVSGGVVNGATSSAPFYDQGDNDWAKSTGTVEEGDSRFAIPNAPYGNYTAKALGTDYMPIIVGGLPDYVLYHRWTAQISDYGDESED